MILITGATGQSGVAIVKALSAKGKPFKVLVRNPAKAASVRLSGAELITGDLADRASLAAALKGVDVLLLNSGPTPDLAELQTGVIRAAKEAGVQRIVKFSAAGASPAARARFGRLHGQVEEALKQSGLAWTILRPTFFMENLLSMKQMIDAGTIYQPTGNGKAPFVAVDDIGAAAAGALTSAAASGKIYHITGPQDLGYADIAAIFSKVLGRSVKYQDVPPEAARQGMIQAGIPEWVADGINELSAELKAGNFAGPTDAVEQLAGRKPMSLEQWLGKYWPK